MTPTMLVRITRRDLGLSVQGFADELGVGARIVRRWEMNERDVPGPVLRLCEIWRHPACPPELKPQTMM